MLGPIKGISANCHAAAWIAVAVAALIPTHAPAAPKPDSEAMTPGLVPIKTEHCHHMYGLVEEQLKDRSDLVSTATRNGLKDFFVIRPGVIDCRGSREIPWRDAKDKDFIESVLQATNAAFKPGLDMTKDYAVAPAPVPVKPLAR
jgi:hypothetical protein